MPEPYYADDKVMIWHGDSRDVLPWTFAQFLVTDPPYGIGYAGVEGGGSRKGRTTGTNGVFRGVTVHADDSTTARDEVLELWGDKPALVFGSWKAPRPAATRAVLVWEKGGAAGMGDLAIPWRPNTEEIYVLGSGFVGHRGSSVLRHNAISPNFVTRDHPTQKPLPLMRDLLAKCPGTIADPFMGSGTTLRAAKDLGLPAVGVELDERYCEIAAKRMAQEVLDFGGVA